MSVINALFRRPRRERIVARCYLTLVDQSRLEAFYRDCGVPDTTMGRFDMLVLHAFLVMQRLKRSGPEAEAFSQALFDYMFADMDVNLRELGVGDLSVGKKVKKLAQGFYGRAVAYEAGLGALAEHGDAEVLRDALRRNLFGGSEPSAEHVNLMAGYLRREVESLARQPMDRLLAGEVVFGPPPAAPVREPAASGQQR